MPGLSEATAEADMQGKAGPKPLIDRRGPGRRMTSVAVIGGGIVGSAAAIWLAADGFDVTVFERDPEGRPASTGNAGVITLRRSRRWRVRASSLRCRAGCSIRWGR